MPSLSRVDITPERIAAQKQPPSPSATAENDVVTTSLNLTPYYSQPQHEEQQHDQSRLNDHLEPKESNGGQLQQPHSSSSTSMADDTQELHASKSDATNKVTNGDHQNAVASELDMNLGPYKPGRSSSLELMAANCRQDFEYSRGGYKNIDMSISGKLGVTVKNGKQCIITEKVDPNSQFNVNDIIIAVNGHTYEKVVKLEGGMKIWIALLIDPGVKNIGIIRRQHVDSGVMRNTVFDCVEKVSLPPTTDNEASLPPTLLIPSDKKSVVMSLEHQSKILNASDHYYIKNDRFLIQKWHENGIFQQGDNNVSDTNSDEQTLFHLVETSISEKTNGAKNGGEINEKLTTAASVFDGGDEVMVLGDDDIVSIAGEKSEEKNNEKAIATAAVTREHVVNDSNHDSEESFHTAASLVPGGGEPNRSTRAKDLQQTIQAEKTKPIQEQTNNMLSSATNQQLTEYAQQLQHQLHYQPQFQLQYHRQQQILQQEQIIQQQNLRLQRKGMDWDAKRGIWIPLADGEGDAANVQREVTPNLPAPTIPTNTSRDDSNGESTAKGNTLPNLERCSEYRINAAKSITELEAIRHRLLTLLETTNSRLKEMRVQRALGNEIGIQNPEKLSIKQLVDILSEQVEGTNDDNKSDGLNDSAAGAGKRRHSETTGEQSLPARKRQRCCPLCLNTAHLQPVSQGIAAMSVTCSVCEDSDICSKCCSICLKCRKITCADCFASCRKCESSVYCSDCVDGGNGMCSVCCSKEERAQKRKKSKISSRAPIYPQLLDQVSQPTYAGNLKLPPPLQPNPPPQSNHSKVVGPNKADSAGSYQQSLHRFFLGLDFDKLGCFVSQKLCVDKLVFIDVAENSLAAKHGVHEGDELVVPGMSGMDAKHMLEYFQAAIKQPPMIFHVHRSSPHPTSTIHRFVIHEHGKLGVQIRCTGDTAIISQVFPGSLAEKHGLCMNDLLCKPFTNGDVFGTYKWFLERAKSSVRPFVIEVWRKKSVAPVLTCSRTSLHLFGDENPFLYRLSEEASIIDATE